MTSVFQIMVSNVLVAKKISLAYVKHFGVVPNVAGYAKAVRTVQITSAVVIRVLTAIKLLKANTYATCGQHLLNRPVVNLFFSILNVVLKKRWNVKRVIK